MIDDIVKEKTGSCIGIDLTQDQEWRTTADEMMLVVGILKSRRQYRIPLDRMARHLYV